MMLHVNPPLLNEGETSFEWEKKTHKTIYILYKRRDKEEIIRLEKRKED